MREALQLLQDRAHALLEADPYSNPRGYERAASDLQNTLRTVTHM